MGDFVNNLLTAGLENPKTDDELESNLFIETNNRPLTETWRRSMKTLASILASVHSSRLPGLQVNK